MKSSRASCPCCAFLEQDLFLPPTAPSSTTTTENPSPVQEQEESEPVSPQEALNIINDYCQELQESKNGAIKNKPPILIVDTHNHAHLQQERHEAYIDGDGDNDDERSANNTKLISLSLAVEIEDWEDAIQYSAAVDSSADAVSDWTLFGLGIHPWYLDNLPPESDWTTKLKALLQEHPSAIVGEIGLCKMAKCARNHPEGKSKGFELQRSVLETQLQIAIEYRRPVSIHCVQQHGVFLDILQNLISKSSESNEYAAAAPSLLVPPAMAMHSFTGTAHHVKTLLTWEATLFGEGPNDKKHKKRHKKKNQGEHNTPDDDNLNNETKRRKPLLYFGFSHIVNYGMCTSEKARRQGREAVRAVPLDRLLAESDVHHSSDVASGTAGAVAYIAWALERPIPEIAELTARNGLSFLQSHLLREE